VIAYLKESGLYDSSIIVFTADHGENLYDHGLDLGHGEHFRGEWATHVPLIIKFPENRARHIRVKSYSGVSEQVDFLPTVLDALGLPAKGDYPGISMMPIAEGKRESVEKIAYAETGIWFVDTGSQFFQKQRIMYPDVSRLCRVEGRGNQIVLKEEYRELIILAKHRTVFDGRFKLIYIPTREGVRWELYRIGDASFTNLYREDHPEFRRLYRYLAGFEERYEKARVVHGFFLTEP
jgi:hypothetical protein